MTGLVPASHRYLVQALWGTDPALLPRWKAVLVWLARGLYVLTRDLVDGELTLRAMSLVFTTLLSLVPLLAVSFSVLKAFGVHNQIEPVLLNFLAPLGEKGVELTQQIVSFVDNVQVGVLGSVGVGLLIYTTISLIQKIEAAFNYTWRVERARSFGRRFSNYLSVLLVGPVLVFSAIGFAASVMNSPFVQGLVAMEPFGTLYRALTLAVPYVLIVAALSLTYFFIPNTRVHFEAAVFGGVLAGAAWVVSGKLFTSFVMASTQYTAIYSGFAIVLLFMIWLYLSWLIVLVGAGIAFYRQHPEYLVPVGRGTRISNRAQERLALMLMTAIGERFRLGQRPWTEYGLAQCLNVPAPVINELLDVLRQGGLLVQTEEDPPTYLPAQDLEHVKVRQLLEVVGNAHGSVHLDIAYPEFQVVDELIDTIDRAVEASLDDLSIKDLVDRSLPRQPEVVVSTLPQSVVHSNGQDGR